jgi:ATP adenylyltransferase
MDQLWAPWRLSYVAQAQKPAEGDPCFICRCLSQQNDRENLVVLRRPYSVVMLNRFPYNNGHLLIAPSAHKAHLTELTSEEMLESMQVLRDMVEALKKTICPEGFNIGINLGRVAGAGLPGHLHWHIVPRWNGDTNFMPILGDVKVIVQSLEAMYDLLVEK